MSSRRTRVAGVIVFGGFLAVTGVHEAYANRLIADADCSGVTVDVPRTEDGTTVTVSRNGTVVRTVSNDVFGARVAFTVPSPDLTQPQVWVVSVSGHNGSERFTETVPACIAPSSSSTTSTVAPTPSTVPGTTVVTTVPPAPSSTTVVTLPRPTTTSTVPPVFELPATASDHGMELAVGLGSLGAGFGCVVAARRKGRTS